jgi:hypothetical protein
MTRLLWSGLARAVAVVAIIFLIGEIAPRLLGLTDFPIYRLDPDLGYVPEPNQSGRFLNENRWVFNDYGMATASPWNPTLGSNILLIGNSIVQGGNPLDQKDRLGTVLQDTLGPRYRVWPIGAGGWSTVNETNYLEHFDDVRRSSNFFIWEYIAGGLSALSQGRSEYLTPSVRPRFATWYHLARRYLLPRYFNFKESELPPTGDAQAANLERFEDMINQLTTPSNGQIHGVIFLYPESRRLAVAREGKEWLPERAQIESIARRHQVFIVDIAAQREWSSSLYRDGTHLTPQGNQGTRC